MPPYRANLGGAFGSGITPRGSGNIDITSAIREVGNQASSLIQSAYLRKLAEAEKRKADAAEAQAREDKRLARELDAARRAEDVAFRNQQFEFTKQEAERRAELERQRMEREVPRVVNGAAITRAADGSVVATPVQGLPAAGGGVTPRIDPLSDEGIRKAAERVKALAAASPAGAITGRAPTEAQEKSALFYGVVQRSGKTLDELERTRGAEIRPLAVKAALGLWGGNYLLNDAEQAYLRAAREFAAGVLRKESGAAITDSEVRDVFARYIGLPGDSKSSKALKRQARNQYTSDLERSALPAIRYYEAVQKNGLPPAQPTDRFGPRPPGLNPDDPDF